MLLLSLAVVPLRVSRGVLPFEYVSSIVVENSTTVKTKRLPKLLFFSRDPLKKIATHFFGSHRLKNHLLYSFFFSHLVDVEELVEVEQQPGQVGDEEHADHAHQDERQLEVLGLEDKWDRCGDVSSLNLYTCRDMGK